MVRVKRRYTKPNLEGQVFGTRKVTTETSIKDLWNYVCLECKHQGAVRYPSLKYRNCPKCAARSAAMKRTINRQYTYEPYDEADEWLWSE
jgi:hypothetical protein